MRIRIRIRIGIRIRIREPLSSAANVALKSLDERHRPVSSFNGGLSVELAAGTVSCLVPFLADLSKKGNEGRRRMKKLLVKCAR